MSRERRLAYWYEHQIAAAEYRPLVPGTYLVRIVEGGVYRRLDDLEKRTVESLDEDDRTMAYRRGDQLVEDAPPGALGVVGAVGENTPPALARLPRATGGAV